MVATVNSKQQSVDFPLYGLTIIPHHTKLENEKPLERPSLLRAFCEQEGNILSIDTKKSLIDLLDIHEFELMPVLKERWPDAPENLHNGYASQIIPGILEYRPIFIMLYAKLTQMIKLKRQARIEMEEIILLLAEISYKLIQDRLNLIQEDPEKKLTLNQFSFNINADKYEKNLNPAYFFQYLDGEYTKNFLKFYKGMIPVTASFSKCNSNITSFFKKIKFGLYNLYYRSKPEKSSKQIIEFFKTVTVKEGKALWNLQDDPLFRIFLFMALPTIDYSKMFSIPSFTYDNLITQPVKHNYLQKKFSNIWEFENKKKLENKVPIKEPKIDNSVDKLDDNIDNHSNIVIGNSNDENINLENNSQVNDYTQDSNNNSKGDAINSDEVEIEVLQLQDIRNPFSYQLASNRHEFPPISSSGGISPEEFHFIRTQLHFPLRNYKNEKIDIRLIYHGENSHIKSFNFNKSRRDYPILTSFKKLFAPRKHNKIDDSEGNVIVMIHGGGMVAMSTFSHECYMRRLAIKTGMPIFMIEYTTAPQERFPTQIEQCYHAYKWIVEHAKEYLGVELNKIFITGDSAGGNFSCALTYRCIEDEYRKPDGVILTYPATNISKSPSTSRIISYIDPLVNINFLKLCSENYPQENNNIIQNAFLSPAFAPDVILEQFPPTFICVGGLDPLYDDSIMLAERLTKLIGYQNVCVHVYDGLGHGFMNAIDLVGEGHQIIRSYSLWIHGIIARDQKRFQIENESHENFNQTIQTIEIKD